jgi:isopentenyl phosphate kinase
MEKLILIKLGGSLITDKTKALTPRMDVIERLGKEILLAQKLSKIKIFLSHGQGSYAHIPASKYQIQKGLINKNSIKGFAITADMATWPNRILVKEFVGLGIPAVSFSPLGFVFSNNQKLDEIFTKQIEKALDLGIMPVIYGDVIMDSKMGFCIYSGEKTLDLLALKLSKKYKIEKIIMAGDTNGVYDENGRTITKITPKNFAAIKSALGGSKSTDVTGGMLHKVEESLELVKKLDTKVYILSGLVSGNLKKAILGKFVLGTIIGK